MSDPAIAWLVCGLFVCALLVPWMHWYEERKQQHQEQKAFKRALRELGEWSKR